MPENEDGSERKRPTNERKGKLMKARWILVASLMWAFVAWAGTAGAECESVKGRVVSELVSTFSNGESCPSPLGLCTEGRFSGDLAGRFAFVAASLNPYETLPGVAFGSVPPDIAATTGSITLEPRDLCDGVLALSDTSTFSLGPDGFFAGIETLVPQDDACGHLTGRIRIQGVFIEGCVDCKYEGEVCGLDSDDDDDDD